MPILVWTRLDNCATKTNTSGNHLLLGDHLSPWNIEYQEFGQILERNLT